MTREDDIIARLDTIIDLLGHSSEPERPALAAAQPHPTGSWFARQFPNHAGKWHRIDEAHWSDPRWIMGCDCGRYIFTRRGAKYLFADFPQGEACAAHRVLEDIS